MQNIINMLHAAILAALQTWTPQEDDGYEQPQRNS